MEFLKKSLIANLFKVKDVEGYENLQKRISNKKEFLEKILSCFNNLDNSLKDISKKILNIKSTLKNIPLSPEEKDIHVTSDSILSKIYKTFEENKNFVDKLIRNLSSHISKLGKEESYYEELKTINRNLQDEKEKLNKNKETYHKVAKDVENKIKKRNYKNTNQIYGNEYLFYELEEITNNAKRALKNYRQSIESTNEQKIKFNEKQNEIFNYLPGLSNEDGVFFFNLVKLYLQSLEDESKFINNYINEIKNTKSLGTNNQLNELIEKTEKNKIYEKNVSLVQYQTELDSTKCQDDKEFELFANSVNIINNYIDKDIFPNYNYDKELNNYKISSIIKKLFKEKGEIDSKLSDDFLNLLNDSNVHKSAFIILSKLRANSNFLRTKYLIELLGKGFNILLDYAGKNKLYDNINNCIILSQTYYHEDDDKNKIYIYEYFNKNNILQNTKFWRDYIDDMIKKELRKFEDSFPYVNFDIEKNLKITEKIRNKLDEIIFSQLLTYSNNMKDFNIDKRVRLKIIDEFIEKYNYVSENNINIIYEMISQGEDNIEKLRKEYNSSLETELNGESKANNIDNNKEDDKKENKEIEKKEQDKNIEENSKKEENDNKKDNNENESNINNEEK